MNEQAPTSVPSVGGAPPSLESIDVTFADRGDRLIGLGFVNGLLRLITLGLYSFWAKTEVRRRLWSFTRLNGEPLEYTGSGKELFLGFLIMFGVIALPALFAGVAVAAFFGPGSGALALYQIALYLLFFLLIGNAIYRAQRYRLSRTRWRGIRGALVGSPGGYGWLYFWSLAAPFAVIAAGAFFAAKIIGPAVGGVLVVVGVIAGLWVLPWRANALQRRLTNDMRFGDAPLVYSGGSGPLYRRYLYTWLGSALTLAAAAAVTGYLAMNSDAIRLWTELRMPPSAAEILAVVGVWFLALILIAVITASYRAAQFRHFASHTAIGDASFRSDVTGRGLAWLVVSNWLITALGLILGAMAGAAVVAAFGAVPSIDEFEVGARPEGTMLKIGLAFTPIVVFTTAAATFAQFRSARYFMSRLKLDGRVDLAAIRQSAYAGPKLGEGLAQVFDIDAF